MRAESLADIAGRRNRIGIAVRSLRIHVDQAHLHRAERILQLAFAAVAFVAKPSPLRPPVEFFRFPDVGAAAAEAKRLKAHRLQCDVAGKNHEVGPGDLPAVLLLDRPQQAARLVQVRVVGPAIERREALLAGAGAAAAVGDAVRARAVPCHADEQAAVVTEVGWPPVLRVGHQRTQVLDHRIEIKALEFLRIVERLAHRVGQGRMLVESLKVQLVRPPVTIRPAYTSRVHDRALAGTRVSGCAHLSLHSWLR